MASRACHVEPMLVLGVSLRQVPQYLVRPDQQTTDTDVRVTPDRLMETSDELELLTRTWDFTTAEITKVLVYTTKVLTSGLPPLSYRGTLQGNLCQGNPTERLHQFVVASTSITLLATLTLHHLIVIQGTA